VLERQRRVLVDESAHRHEVPRHALGRRLLQATQIAPDSGVEVGRGDAVGQCRFPHPRASVGRYPPGGGPATGLAPRPAVLDWSSPLAPLVTVPAAIPTWAASSVATVPAAALARAALPVIAPVTARPVASLVPLATGAVATLPERAILSIAVLPGATARALPALVTRTVAAAAVTARPVTAAKCAAAPVVAPVRTTLATIAGAAALPIIAPATASLCVATPVVAAPRRAPLGAVETLPGAGRPTLVRRPPFPTLAPVIAPVVPPRGVVSPTTGRPAVVGLSPFPALTARTVARRVIAATSRPAGAEAGATVTTRGTAAPLPSRAVIARTIRDTHL
jgi:hypothetical protein